MPNVEEISMAVEGLEELWKKLYIVQKAKTGVDSIALNLLLQSPDVYIDSTGVVIAVDKVLLCINTALQVLNKRLGFHARRLDDNGTTSLPVDFPFRPIPPVERHIINVLDQTY